MNSSTHMNYLALNQIILNKGLIIGAWPQEGISKTTIITADGLQVFLNRTHVIPEHEELDKWTFKDDTLYSFLQYHFELKNKPNNKSK
jgi:hypothetical protein